VLAEPLFEQALIFGPADGTPARASFDGAPGITAGDVIAKACSSGALILALIWAAAALVLPWLVRGRSLQSDIVRATAWAAGLAAGTAALGESLGERVGQPEPRGLVAGAVVAAVVALVAARPFHVKRFEDSESDREEC
jgi:eukaryotic-like serine/threonine-protein kinase